MEQITGSGSRRETLLSEESELEHLIRELFESQKLAVLGTQNEGQPYANLVAFAPSHDLKCLYFVTARATRKYANIEADARVTVLIDNRSNQDSDFSQAAAVTATGTAQEVVDAKRDEVLAIYLAKHPMLEDFVRSPSCALLQIRVETYYLVRRFQNVMELHVK
ncbi:MAG: pyridoxamine 5'-phosphate oxidase family protein [Deltaproteobacteria bacterium]|nr:pyridoxamine 5'-phosphate oxidase family protein [Deltaproteobacteria bacterium]MDH3926865.1 pyridoxamine 5'-phosphate oxidase family protein [Deltaproteobacteria bacterium]MDH3963800.1 pyridoxamine 5'-phosphate oxidase family protein [Deltaproteobacteria bacterium]